MGCADFFHVAGRVLLVLVTPFVYDDKRAAASSCYVPLAARHGSRAAGNGLHRKDELCRQMRMAAASVIRRSCMLPLTAVASN